MSARNPLYTAEEFAPRSRDLRLYLAIRFATTLGTQIQSVAIGWQVYDITRDPVALGYVGLSIFLPMAEPNGSQPNSSSRIHCSLTKRPFELIDNSAASSAASSAPLCP